jgi:hypothetical protein
MTKTACGLLGVLAVLVSLTGCFNIGGGGGNNNPIVVVITNKFLTIPPGNAPVVLTVTTNDSKGVTWTITANGAACQPGCGTLSAPTSGSVNYTPPANLPASPNNQPTITATSVMNHKIFDTDAFTIETSVMNLPLLHGQYAFVVSGFDASGKALGIAGSFTANGQGSIAGGEMDVNDDGVLGSNTTPLAGSYTLDENLRGIVTFTNAITNLTHTPSFSFTVDSTGTTGSLISLDANEIAASGSLHIQQLVQPSVVVNAKSSPSGMGPVAEAVSPGAPPGNFVFRARWNESGVNQVGVVGRLTINADSTISSGLLDSADAVSGNDLVGASATGGSTAPDGNGRGTLTLNINAVPTPVKFAYYEVSSQKVYLQEIDAGAPPAVSVLTGEARSQGSLPFAGGSASGTSAFGLIGAESGFVPVAPAVAIGQLVISGTSASVTSDLNDFASVNTNVSSTGTVIFNLNTGRGTITFSGGFSDGFVDSVVFYLQSSGLGVILDTTATSGPTLNEALVGDFLPQSAGPFGNSSLNGNLMAVDSIAGDPFFVPTVVGAVVANDSTQAIAGYGDAAFAGFTPLTNQSLAASYSPITGSTGRGKAVVPGLLFGLPTENVNASFYIVGTNQFFLIALNDSKNKIVESALGVFNPVGTLPVAALQSSEASTANVPRVARVSVKSNQRRQPELRIVPPARSSNH